MPLFPKFRKFCLKTFLWEMPNVFACCWKMNFLLVSSLPRCEIDCLLISIFFCSFWESKIYYPFFMDANRSSNHETITTHLMINMNFWLFVNILKTILKSIRFVETYISDATKYITFPFFPIVHYPRQNTKDHWKSSDFFCIVRMEEWLKSI